MAKATKTTKAMTTTQETAPTMTTGLDALKKMEDSFSDEMNGLSAAFEQIRIPIGGVTYFEMPGPTRVASVARKQGGVAGFQSTAIVKRQDATPSSPSGSESEAHPSGRKWTKSSERSPNVNEEACAAGRPEASSVRPLAPTGCM